MAIRGSSHSIQDNAKNDILLTLLPRLLLLTYKQYLMHNGQAYIRMISVPNFTCLAQTVSEVVTATWGQFKAITTHEAV